MQSFILSGKGKEKEGKAKGEFLLFFEQLLSISDRDYLTLRFLPVRLFV
jgi:hypothetical protein